MGACQTIESKYDVQYKRFGCEKAAGKGAFGEVRPCTHSSSHTLRAVKSIEKTDWSIRGHVLEEIEILKAVAGRHPNIINFVEYFEEWSVLNLIFEYCPKGSLEQAIEQSPSRLAESFSAPLAWQISSALAFLHEVYIAHCDVKPANLLFADKCTLKLADFGSAHTGSEPLMRPRGTPAFFAPEVLMLPRGQGFSFPVDAWATGVTLYMLLFKGAHPFEDGGRVCKQSTLSGDFDAGWFATSRVRDLLEWLLMPHPGQRIKPAEALEHSWFASHQLGGGSFTKEKPCKLIQDSYGNWLKSRD